MQVGQDLPAGPGRERKIRAVLIKNISCKDSELLQVVNLSKRHNASEDGFGAERLAEER